MTTRYVLLDRDGTIIEERHHLRRVEDVALLPGALRALQAMRDRGFKLVLVTNQSVIGRGMLTEEGLTGIHDKLRSLLAEGGVELAGIYHCPHAPDAGCSCRKPGTELATRAARDLGFELSSCIVVGDKPSDVDMGRAIGATTIMVRTGHGAEFERLGQADADHVTDDLPAAALVMEGMERATEAATERAPSASEEVAHHFLGGARLREELVHDGLTSVLEAAEALTARCREGGKILICGNGGSAADSQHFAAELTSRLCLERPAIPAIALTTDSSFLTAHANDYSFETVFSRQVEALGRPGDALIAITTSGNSLNVLRAVEEARSRGILTVGLCGEGGLITELADIVISVPSKETQLVQECHLAIEHCIAYHIEKSLYGGTFPTVSEAMETQSETVHAEPARPQGVTP